MPGDRFSYKIGQATEPVFTAEARARRRPASPIGSWSSATAPRARPSRRRSPTRRTWPARLRHDRRRHRLRRGRISEYREKFWPVYDADEPSPASGRRCCARPCSWLRRATTTSPPATWTSTPTAWPISSTGTSRSTARRDRRGAARPDAARPRGEPGGLPRSRGAGLSRDGELLVRLRQRPLDGPRLQPLRRLDRPGPPRRGSSATWPPPRTPPGASSPSTIPPSTPRRPTSATSGCAVWPTSSRRAGSTSSSAATSTTTSARSRFLRPRTRGPDGKPVRDEDGSPGQLDPRQDLRRPRPTPRPRRDLPRHRGRRQTSTTPSSRMTPTPGSPSPTSSSRRSTRSPSPTSTARRSPSARSPPKARSSIGSTWKSDDGGTIPGVCGSSVHHN